MVPPAPPTAEYSVLCRGRIEGPFTEPEMASHLESGRYSPDDLAQTAGTALWTPLRRLFLVETQSTPPGAGWQKAVRGAGASLMATVRANPFEVGVGCAVAACVLFLLSRVPLLVYGPPALVALWAAGLLLMRGRVVAGLAISVAAVFVPGVLWFAMGGR